MHRDIKPANVILTNDGVVKIIDFGLAKLMARRASPKRLRPWALSLTCPPEQVQGEIVDHRTDIWSLGVVLYEMLTGQLPFKGESDPPVIYSILNEDPKPIIPTRRDSELPIALEQSRRLSFLTRARMFETLTQLGKDDLSHIDEKLGSEICKRADVNTMAIATISKFGRIYAIDIKLLDLEKNRYLLTAKEKGKGQESIPDLIDRLAETIRRGLNEEETEIQAASLKVAEVMTTNFEAYQHYFQGEQFLHQFKEQEAQKEFEKAIWENNDINNAATQQIKNVIRIRARLYMISLNIPIHI